MSDGVFLIPDDPERPERMAAAYLALLAYPDDAAQARRFVWALIAAYIRDSAARDPEWAWRARSIEPALLLQDRATENKAMKEGLYRLKGWRFPAAMMMQTMIMDWTANGSTFRCFVDGKKVNATNLAGWMAYKLSTETPAAGWGDRESPTWRANHVSARIWKASKPVLHMAIPALQAARSLAPSMEARRNSSVDPVNVFELLRTPWVSKAVDQAELLRIFIMAEAPKHRFPLELMIRVNIGSTRRALH